MSPRRSHPHHSRPPRSEDDRHIALHLVIITTAAMLAWALDGPPAFYAVLALAQALDVFTRPR
jgi:hypothetical protein